MSLRDRIRRALLAARWPETCARCSRPTSTERAVDGRLAYCSPECREADRMMEGP